MRTGTADRGRAIFLAVVVLCSTLVGVSLISQVLPTGNHGQGQTALQPDQANVITHNVKECSAVTTCSTNSTAMPAYATIVILIDVLSNKGPSTVAIHGLTITNETDIVESTTISAFIYAVGNVTSASYVTYVNFSASTTYSIDVIDAGNASLPTFLDAKSSGTVSSGSTSASCTVTTATANDLVISTTAVDGSTSFTAGSGQTNLDKTVDGATLYGESSWKVDTTTGSFSMSQTITSHAWAMISIALKVAGDPSAPTGLSDSSITTTGVTLSWSGPKGPIVNDTVLQAAESAGSCGSYSTKHSTSGDTHSYAVTGLTSGDVYCFEVEGWNSTGASAASSALTGVQTANDPAAPGSFSCSAVVMSTTSAFCTWTLPPGTLSNVTLYRTNSGGACGTYPSANTISTGDPAATQWTVGSLSAGDTYCMIAQAWNATGGGTDSSTSSFTTNALPGAPTTLASSAQTLTSVTLTWVQGSGTIVNDTVYYGTSCGHGGPSSSPLGWINDSVGKATTATVTGLNPYTSYCFAVGAWTAGGAGPTDDTFLNVTTLAAIPSQPTNLAATGETTSTISISWTQGVASSGSIVNDTVYYGTACSPFTGATTSGAATSFTISGLSSGTSYCVEVTAWSQGGQSAASSTITVSTTTSSSAPSDLAEVSASRTVITVSWTNNGAGIVNNTVYYTTGSNCAGTMTAISTSGATLSWSISGLTAFTTYHIAVTAWTSSVQQSAQSNCLSATAQSSTPPQVTSLSVTPTSTTAALTWTNPAQYSLFNDSVEVTAAGGSCGTWSQKISMNGVVQAYTITGLTASQTYCVAVIAWDGPSNATYANFTTLTGQGATSPGYPLGLPPVYPPTIPTVILAVPLWQVVIGAAAIVLGTYEGARRKWWWAGLLIPAGFIVAMFVVL